MTFGREKTFLDLPFPQLYQCKKCGAFGIMWEPEPWAGHGCGDWENLPYKQRQIEALGEWELIASGDEARKHSEFVKLQKKEQLYDPTDELPEYDEDEEELEEGEVNLFASMPWINDRVGSLMDAQLLQYREPNQCRNCGKIDESLRQKKVEERFCAEKCKQEWTRLLDTRIAQGKHDLRTRGYD